MQRDLLLRVACSVTCQKYRHPGLRALYFCLALGMIDHVTLPQARLVDGETQRMGQYDPSFASYSISPPLDDLVLPFFV